ncbi:MAG: hypothetical protein ACSHX7_04945 [Luteolibacter sp.]
MKRLSIILISVFGIFLGSCERHDFKETRKLHDHGSHDDHASADDHGSSH